VGIMRALLSALPILFLTGFVVAAPPATASPPGSGADLCPPAAGPECSMDRGVLSLAPEADTLVVLAGVVRAPGYRPDGLLPGALVTVRQEGTTRTAVVGPGGEYRITGLGSGPARVTVSHVAAVPMNLEVHLPPRGTATVDVEVDLRAIVLAPLTLRLDPALNRPVAPLGDGDRRRAALRLRGLEATSGMAEAGMAAAFSRSIGDEDVRDPDRALFMRGSTVDARMVILDGAPVLTPFHVAGLVAPFDAELLGDASLFLGGAPARYQGGLSYLLDLDTREPRRDRTRMQLGVDGVSARGVLEAPLPGGGGLLVGGRGIHGAQERLGGGGDFPYMYQDILARVSLPLGEGESVRLTGFRNREGVRLALEPERLPGRDRSDWGNQVVSGVYRSLMGPVALQITGAVSRYDSALPLPWEDPILARALQDRRLVATELSFPLAGGRLEVGSARERMDLRYALEDGPTPAASILPVARDAELGAAKWSAHAEWDSGLFGGVGLRGGLRAEYTDHDGRTRLAPRAGIRILAGENTLLRVDMGKFHQLVPSPGLEARYRPDDPNELVWEPRLGTASASHLVVGLEQEFRPDLRLDLSAMAKSFRGLGEEGERNRTSGVELRLARDGERMAAWLGYTLSWFWTVEGARGATRFDGRHLLSTGFRAEIAPGLELGGSLGYGAGLPFSAVTPASAPEAFQDGLDSVTRPLGTGGARRIHQLSTAGSPLEPAPPDDFLRMDLELGWRLHPSLGNRRTELRPYFRAMNALNRRDAMFYYFDRWREDEVRPLTERAFTPVLGVEWRF